MTRTPTNSVTAIAILANAARAFAWDVFPGERLSGLGPEALPSLLR